MRPNNVWAIFIIVVLMCCVSPLTKATPIGLTAWWSGDLDATDVSGNGHNAVLENGTQAGVPGLIGGAFQLDGNDDFISTSLTLSDQGTFSLWVNPVALVTLHGILGTFGTNNGNNRLWLSASGVDGGPGVGADRMAANFGSCCENSIDVSTPLVVGEWTHLALTFDYAADMHALYADGIVIGSSAAIRSTPTEVLSLGALLSDFGQYFYFHGLMDEIQLYNRVLDELEITTIAAVSVPEPGTLALFGIGLAGLGFARRKKLAG